MAPLWLGERLQGGPAEVDPSRLTRHGVVFGATGSGKTGLCVCMLEELALAGVPVLAIDPKGDLANLVFRFEGPTAADLRPWVDEGVAERAGVTADAWAAQQAQKWSAGRAASGVDASRIARLVNDVEVVVHTPGSSAGVPVDVLGGLEAPPADLASDPEALAELAAGAVSALLDLVGVKADRLSDPRHIVLSTVLERGWAAGDKLGLDRLIMQLIDPPFDKVGVFPLEQFFERKDRMALAMQLNGLVASSGFAAWRQGVGLDFDELLAPVNGKTPIRVFALAHLDETQRQFFAAMMLHTLVAWSRRQQGTSALRALLYIDEAYGYCPPHPHKPATKQPIMHLIKQARAVGLGVLITSQNPVDVDYAVLSNAGTWWLGRLATVQDRRRVLEGLSSDETDVLEGAIEKLGKWQFAIRPAGKAPWVLKTRHAITWLRGPMTLREIEQLAQSSPSSVVSAPSAPVARSTPSPSSAAPSAPSAQPDVDDGWLRDMPPVPNGYPVYWLDPAVAHAARFSNVVGEASQPHREDGCTAWEPALFAKLHLRFDERDFVSERSEERLFFPLTRDGGFVGFPGFEGGDLLNRAPGPSVYAPIPSHADEPRELKEFERRVKDALLRGETDEMYLLSDVRLKSRGGETMDEFRSRARDALTDGADAEIAKLKDKVERSLKRLEDKHEKRTRDASRYADEARAKLGSEVVNAGEIMMSMFFGRRRTVTTAMTKRESTRRAQTKAAEATEDIRQLDREIYELEHETEQEIEEIRRRWDGKITDVEVKQVRLEKDDLSLRDFGIVWIPVSRPL